MTRAEGPVDAHCRSLLDSSGLDGTRARICQIIYRGLRGSAAGVVECVRSAGPRREPMRRAAPYGADERRSLMRSKKRGAGLALAACCGIVLLATAAIATGASS